MSLINNKDFPNYKPKNIFYVWNYLEWGGVQIYFLGLMRSVSQEYKVKVILPNGSEEKILRYLEENYFEYEFFEGKIDFEKAETIRRRIERRVNDFFTNLSLAKHLSQYNLKDAIVQIDVAPWAGLILLFYLTLKTNVFVALHTAMPQLGFLRQIWWKIKFAILTASKRFHLTASNLDVKKSLKPFVGESVYQKIEIVYSSVNVEEIDRALSDNVIRQEIAQKYNFSADKTWVCNVAQFIERKGCWIFLEAIEILHRQRSDLFFYWMGTAPLKDEIIKRIEEFDTRDNFRFLSADEIGTSRNDLLVLWKATDLFVLPSFQEGLPVALIEAMALGKACVASRVNAIPEAVKHFETGILTDAGDSEKLAQAISSLADNKSLQKKLGENARRFVLDNFDEKITGQKMLRIYKNIDA